MLTSRRVNSACGERTKSSSAPFIRARVAHAYTRRNLMELKKDEGVRGSS